jgi:hypothetical protein
VIPSGPRDALLFKTRKYDFEPSLNRINILTFGVNQGQPCPSPSPTRCKLELTAGLFTAHRVDFRIHFLLENVRVEVEGDFA